MTAALTSELELPESAAESSRRRPALPYTCDVLSHGATSHSSSMGSLQAIRTLMNTKSARLDWLWLCEC